MMDTETKINGRQCSNEVQVVGQSDGDRHDDVCMQLLLVICTSNSVVIDMHKCVFLVSAKNNI